MKNNIVVILYTVPVMSAHALTLLCFLVMTIILKSSVYICLLNSNSGVRPMSLGTIHVEAPTTQRLIPGLSLGGIIILSVSLTLWLEPSTSSVQCSVAAQNECVLVLFWSFNEQRISRSIVSSSPATSTPSSSTLLAVPVAPETAATLMTVPLVTLTVLLLSSHHLAFALYSLGLKLLRALFHTDLRLLEIGRKPWVCTILAILTLGTEAAEVEGTKLLLLVVFERAVWPKRTEASIVVWA